MSNPSNAETLDARIAAALQTVRQPRPKLVRPIVVIGAGGIVRAAHIPAYKKAGFPVIALMDRDKDKAAAAGLILAAAAAPIPAKAPAASGKKSGKPEPPAAKPAKAEKPKPAAKAKTPAAKPKPTSKSKPAGKAKKRR